MSTNLGEPFVFFSAQNRKTLLGIEKFDEECVLVTHDKVVTKYKVSNLKPLSSWNYKIGFKSPVVYNRKTENYYAVNRNNQIISWTEDTESIEKIKKNTCSTPILKVCSLKDAVKVVYQNGAILSFEESLENKKIAISGILDATATDVFFTQIGLEEVAVFVSSELKYWLVSQNAILSQGKIGRDGAQLKGLDFNPLSNSLITIWSDSELILYDDLEKGESLEKKLGKIETVDCQHNVGIRHISSDHLVLYGNSKSSNTGLKVVLFNAKYRFAQEEKSFKGSGTAANVFGPFSSHMLLSTSTQVLAFSINLSHIQFDDMLGKTTPQDDSQIEVLDWGDSPSEVESITYPDVLTASINDLVKKGLPESKISEIIIQPLMDKKDVASISFLLQNLNKVSEMMLAKLVSYCLRGEERDFSDDQSDGDELSASLPPESPLTGGRKRLLNLILSKSFTTSKLLPEVKRHIAPQDAILFVQNAASQLWDGDIPTSNTENEINHMVMWISVLLDAHYQYCLLTCDQQVATVLNALIAVVDMQISHTSELAKLKPIVELLMKQHATEKKAYVTKKIVFPMTDPNFFV